MVGRRAWIEGSEIGKGGIERQRSEVEWICPERLEPMDPTWVEVEHKVTE